jgi:hypothetical protein
MAIPHFVPWRYRLITAKGLDPKRYHEGGEYVVLKASDRPSW